MKKLILILTVFLMSAAVVNAQNKANTSNLSSEELAKKRTDGIIEKFGLPKKLSTKIYPIMLERITTVRKEKESATPNKDAIKAANEKFAAGMQTILTPQQFQKMKQYWEETSAKAKTKATN